MANGQTAANSGLLERLSAATRKLARQAISHDGKRQRMAISEWRLVKRQRCWSGYQPRRKRQRMANGRRRSQSLFAIRHSLFAAVKG
ncbi:MAG: hypothetical protein RRB24_07770 [Armatimonadota bacterium]|nr:hypothetical protein [Armatimonadota bacterium]MDT7972713.1 hypothetical protein [Armatimonadota bacterium]